MKIVNQLFACILMARCVRSFQRLAIGRPYSLSNLSQRQTLYVPFEHAQCVGRWRLFQSIAPTDGDGKKRVVFLGTPEVAATTLRKLYEESIKDDSSFDIVGVVTQPPKRRKRKGKEEQSPVGMVAEEFNLNLLFPEKVWISG